MILMLVNWNHDDSDEVDDLDAVVADADGDINESHCQG
jgi:hypothetical protein